MTAFDRVKKITDRRGISINELEKRVGISQNVLYGWKKKTPGGENLTKVAKYLDVSTDYILGVTDNPSSYDEKPKEVDIDDEDVIFSFDGKPVSEEEREFLLSVLESYRKTKK